MLSVKLTRDIPTVDGAAWRTSSANPGSEFPYPDFLLSGEAVSGVKGGKKSKL